VKQRNEEADADEGVLRLSMDAKATVKVGPFARGGKSRVLTKAADHDAGADGHRDTGGHSPARLR
jgi:hypothetical protein